VKKSVPPKQKVISLCEMPLCARAGDIMHGTKKNCWITAGHRALSER